MDVVFLRQWKEALRLSHRFDRDDLIDAIIAPAAATATTAFVEEFIHKTESIQQYTTRLQEIRKKRQAMETTVGETGSPPLPLSAFHLLTRHASGRGRHQHCGRSQYLHRSNTTSFIAQHKFHGIDRWRKEAQAETQDEEEAQDQTGIP